MAADDVAAAMAAETLGAAKGAGAAANVAPRAATTGVGRLEGMGTDEEAAATAAASSSLISIPTAAVAAAASADRGAGRGRTVRDRRRFLAAGGAADGEPGERSPTDTAVVAAGVPEPASAAAVAAEVVAEVEGAAVAPAAGATAVADTPRDPRGAGRGAPEVAPVRG